MLNDKSTPFNTKALLLLIGLAIAVLVFESTLNREFIGSDDAYIHLRYIDNLRNGRGFGFNPEMPSNGSTSPLWVLIAAGLTRISDDLPQTTRNISLLAFVTSLFVFYALAFHLTRSRVVGLAATAIYASDPWSLKWAGSAMEASLSSLAVLTAALFIVRSKRTSHFLSAIVVLALATLVRPEFTLLFVLFLALHLSSPDALPTKFGRIAIAVVMYISILIPWLVYSTITFGSPIPNTFFAKTVASTNAVWPVFWYFLRINTVTYWWAWLAGLAILALLLTRSIRRRSVKGIRFHERTALLFWLWAAALPVYYSISRLQTPSTRYLQLTTPLIIVFGLYGVSQIATRFFREINARRVDLVVMVIAAAVIVYASLLNALVTLPSSRDFTSGVLQTYREVGEWLSYNTPARSRVAIQLDVGAIGYYSNREIIDLGGLNNAEVIPYLPDGLSYLFVAKPDFLVLTGSSSQVRVTEEKRFDGVVNPLYSVPYDLGIRSDLQQATGGRRKEEHVVTVYRLDWQ